MALITVKCYVGVQGKGKAVYQINKFIFTTLYSLLCEIKYCGLKHGAFLKIKHLLTNEKAFYNKTCLLRL